MKQTRAEYMALPYTDDKSVRMRRHHEYYSQFVTPYVINLVVSFIGGERILNSRCPHLGTV